MDTVSIREAKAQLSRLVKRAAAGEEITIARRGLPVARLVPIAPLDALAPSDTPRVFGRMRGKIRPADDFDAPLPTELIDSIYADNIEPDA